MTYTLRHFVKGGGAQSLLPDWVNLDFSSIFSDVGSLTFQYAYQGHNANLVVDQAEVAVFDDNGEVPDTRAIIESVDRETPVTIGGKTYFQVTCRTLFKFLDEGAVYNNAYPGTPGPRIYNNATTGKILHETMARSGALGEIQGLTWTFDATKDSAGRAWTQTSSLEIPLGTSILQFVRDLVDRGLVEIRMTGRTVVAMIPDGLGTDRTTGSNPLTLWVGQCGTEAPEKTSSAEIKTVAIVKGDDNRVEEVSDATSVAKYGRRPVVVNASGVTDAGTLRAIGAATLKQKNEIRYQRTLRFPIRDGLPVPMRGLLPGDWIFTDASSNANPVERMRVLQVSITADSADSNGVCTLTLNDLFLDREIRLARQVAGITGGSAGNGGVPSGTDQEDTTRPGRVLGLSAASAAYTDRAGANMAQITATWSALTTNDDGSALTDLDYYEVRWRYSSQTGNDYQTSMRTPETRQSWSPVLINRNVQVWVRAVDVNGNAGEWSEVALLNTARDLTPPPTPSVPVVLPFLGGARVYWDGKGSAGEAMPPDFDLVEVHVSTEANFTPSVTTLYATTPVSGYTPLHDLPYDTPTYVRLIARDLTEPPNKSGASAAVSVQAERLVAADVADAAITAAKVADNAITVGKLAAAAVTSTKIADDSITTPKIAANAVTAVEMAVGTITASSGILGDLAVTTAKIANLAVNNAKIADLTIQDAKIANLSVGKITAGTLGADVVLGARIMTASSGSRVEMNSAGIQAWSGSTRTVNITSGGGVDIIGTFMSGRTNGKRFVISANLASAAAGGANQSGMVFDSGYTNLRDSQIYDNGNYMRFDSPAFGTNANDQGTTMDVGRDALRMYVRGGAVGLSVTNDNFVRLAGSDGGFEKYTGGTWHAGHFNDQAIYSAGTELRIRGRSSGGSIGVYPARGSWFDVWGNGYVHGAFGADSKQFVIPHPTREEHYLVHGCTESPVAGVEYWGSVQLDDNGAAEVVLPHYFEALCKPENRAVLLTAVGTSFPIAASELLQGKFRIFGQAGRRVSWLVKAERRGADFAVEPHRSDYDSTVEPTDFDTPPTDFDAPIVEAPETPQEG